MFGQKGASSIRCIFKRLLVALVAFALAVPACLAGVSASGTVAFADDAEVVVRAGEASASSGVVQSVGDGSVGAGVTMLGIMLMNTSVPASGDSPAIGTGQVTSVGDGSIGSAVTMLGIVLVNTSSESESGAPSGSGQVTSVGDGSVGSGTTMLGLVMTNTTPIGADTAGSGNSGQVTSVGDGSVGSGTSVLGLMMVNTSPQTYEFSVRYMTGGGRINGAYATGYFSTEEGTDVFRLPVDVTRTGYAFEGWYDNEDCTGDALTQFTIYPKGDSRNADRTFWAKWTRLDHPVTELTVTWVFDAPDVVVKQGDQTLSEGNESMTTTVTFDEANPTLPVAFPAGMKLERKQHGWALMGWKAGDERYTQAADGYLYKDASNPATRLVVSKDDNNLMLTAVWAKVLSAEVPLGTQTVDLTLTFGADGMAVTPPADSDYAIESKYWKIDVVGLATAEAEPDAEGTAGAPAVDVVENRAKLFGAYDGTHPVALEVRGKGKGSPETETSGLLKYTLAGDGTDWGTGGSDASETAISMNAASVTEETSADGTKIYTMPLTFGISMDDTARLKAMQQAAASGGDTFEGADIANIAYQVRLSDE